MWFKLTGINFHVAGTKTDLDLGGEVSEKRLLPLGEAFGCFLFDSGESVFAGFQQYSSTLCTPCVYDVAIADIQLPESLEYLYAFFVGRY